jgi:hypothetical protein
MKKNYNQYLALFFITLTLLLSSSSINAQQTQDEYSDGVYWTYEDFKNNKIDVKGKIVGHMYAMGTKYLRFEKEDGKIEKVEMNKAFAARDRRGFLFRVDPKSTKLFMTLIKGSICLYIEAEVFFDASRSNKGAGLDCNKRGWLAGIEGAAYYWVSKEFSGEISKGSSTKNLEELLEGSEAKDILKNHLSIDMAFGAIVEYNKSKPTEGEYFYPSCFHWLK